MVRSHNDEEGREICDGRHRKWVLMALGVALTPALMWTACQWNADKAQAATDARQDIRIEQHEKILDRVDGKLDRILERLEKRP